LIEKSLISSFICFGIIISFPFQLLGQCDSLFFDINQSKPLNENGLILHYSFENECFDHSGNGLDALQFNGVYANGICGQAAQFDGNDFIELPSSSRFLPLQSVTISFWMKTSQSSRFDLIDQRIGDWSVNNHNFGLYFNCCGNTQNIHYNYPNYNGATKKTTLETNSYVFNDGNWHLMTFVKNVNDQSMKMYEDGCLISNRSIVDAEFIVHGTLFIGKPYLNINYYTGLLDEFRIYNRALNLQEIELLKYECKPMNLKQESSCEICISNPQQSMNYSLKNKEDDIHRDHFQYVRQQNLFFRDSIFIECLI